MYATFLSDDYNRLKYFYSDSPSQSTSVSSIIAVNLKNYSTPLGQEQRGHGSEEITHVISSSSPSVTQRYCQFLHTLPSFVSTILFPHKWLIQGLSVGVLFQQHGRKAQQCVQQHRGPSVCSLL